jgi:hypothetical protein
MSLVETLLETARADTDLLVKNDRLGDDFAVPRDVDFILRTPDREKAETVASFVDDNRYGTPHVEAADGGYRVRVVVRMPTTQPVLCSVSALMACLASLFDLEYDGWGCVIQGARKSPPSPGAAPKAGRPPSGS